MFIITYLVIGIVLVSFAVYGSFDSKDKIADFSDPIDVIVSIALLLGYAVTWPMTIYRIVKELRTIKD